MTVKSNTYTKDNLVYAAKIGVFNTENMVVFSQPVSVQHKGINLRFLEVFEPSDEELTNHAMRLSESSLAEGWENEDDEYWKSFL